MSIAFDRLIEAKRGNSIDFCQVTIQHDAHTADGVNHRINLLDRDRQFGFLGHNNLQATICDPKVYFSAIQYSRVGFTRPVFKVPICTSSLAIHPRRVGT